MAKMMSGDRFKKDMASAAKAGDEEKIRKIMGRRARLDEDDFMDGIRDAMLVSSLQGKDQIFMALLPVLVENEECWPAALRYAASSGREDLVSAVISKAPSGSLTVRSAQNAFDNFPSDGAPFMEPGLALLLAGLEKGMSAGERMENARIMIRRSHDKDFAAAIKTLAGSALKKARIDWKNNDDGVTLLGQAIYETASPEIVAWLLEQGADPLARTPIQHNVLGIAQNNCKCSYGNDDTGKRRKAWAMENLRLLEAALARKESEDIGECLPAGKKKGTGRGTNIRA